MAEIVGTLVIRNANAYIVTDAKKEIPVWAWLASHGLKDKLVRIVVTAGRELDDGTLLFVEHE